jgi:hypothetical protein
MLSLHEVVRARIFDLWSQDDIAGRCSLQDAGRDDTLTGSEPGQEPPVLLKDAVREEKIAGGSPDGRAFML